MGDAALYDGSKVVIMSPYQWNKYCHDFNHLNNIAQPPELMKELERLKKEDKDRAVKA